MKAQFAPDFERNEHGWIRFPRDTEFRESLFPLPIPQHQAKANLYLVEALVDYVSEPGDTVMDIMAGTGSILIAGHTGRHVICIEIGPKFAEYIQRAAEHMGVEALVLNSPCQIALPLPCDHVIFSPPYAGIMKSKGKDQLTRDKYGESFEEYTFSHPMNLGQFDDWTWGEEMEKVYKKCWQSIRPGGTLSLITKDHMKDRERVQLTMKAVRKCNDIGFDTAAWFKWEAPGTVYTGIYRARGWEVVDDEDIVVMRKPEVGIAA